MVAASQTDFRETQRLHFQLNYTFNGEFREQLVFYELLKLYRISMWEK